MAVAGTQRKKHDVRINNLLEFGLILIARGLEFQEFQLPSAGRRIAGRTFEVEALAHRTRGRQEFVDGEIQGLRRHVRRLHSRA